MAGAPVNKKKKYVDLDSRIKAIVNRFDETEPMEFLRGWRIIYHVTDLVFLPCACTCRYLIELVICCLVGCHQVNTVYISLYFCPCKYF